MSILTTATVAIASTLIAAYGVGQFTTKSIATEIEIDAPPHAVWAELSDTEGHASWNPFVTHMSGDLTVGRQLNVTVQPAGNAPMGFTPTVLVSDEARELRWVGHLGFKGVFDGEHHFTMEETADGKTLFRQGETFSGMLAYVLFPLIGESTAGGFEAMNAALKTRVEAKG